MIIRTYACNDCGTEFEVTCESNDGDPDCPMCSQVLEWRPGMFAITGNKSRAIDTTQQILEQDFGLTNFKDNQREGDVAAMPPPPQTTVSREAEIQRLSEAAQHVGTPMNDEQRAMAKVFWGSGAEAPPIPQAELLAGAKANTAMAASMGLHPMQLLHDGIKSGQLRTKINVVARAKM